MNFQEALNEYFTFWRSPERDNLPIRAIHRTRLTTRNYKENARRALAKMMGAMHFREGVEVGTLLGESAELWCKKNQDLHLTCVDPYMGYSSRPQWVQEENFVTASERLKPYNATILRKRSTDAVGGFENGSLDFVFIDGNHHFDYVMMDLLCWAPKVRKHGMIILHDYCNFEKAGVVKAVDAYTHCHRIDPWYVTYEVTPCAFWEKGAERAR